MRLYDYKRKAETAAKDFCYSSKIIEAIHNAKTETEVSRIMREARLSMSMEV